MPAYTILLLFAVAHTAIALAWVARAEPAQRPWADVVHGMAEICCALLLRLYFDPPFRAVLGWAAWPVFLFALAWSVVRWGRMTWGLAVESEPPVGSLLAAFGLGLSSGVRRLAAILWHVGFVAPALVCGAFVLLGFARELPPR